MLCKRLQPAIAAFASSRARTPTSPVIRVTRCTIHTVTQSAYTEAGDVGVSPA